MTGHQIGFLLGMIAFFIGAIYPAFETPTRFRFRDINWISLGLAFVTCSYFIGAHK